MPTRRESLSVLPIHIRICNVRIRIVFKDPHPSYRFWYGSGSKRIQGNFLSTVVKLSFSWLKSVLRLYVMNKDVGRSRSGRIRNFFPGSWTYYSKYLEKISEIHIPLCKWYRYGSGSKWIRIRIRIDIKISICIHIRTKSIRISNTGPCDNCCWHCCSWPAPADYQTQPTGRTGSVRWPPTRSGSK